VISLTLACAFLGFVVGQVFHSMMPAGGFYHGITSYNFFTNDDYANGKIVQLPEWIENVLEFMVRYAFAPIFWITTYFRLKEKEI